ncbi:MAG: myo-inosose-2 dehydratase [Clostridiales Family XIII bacterium]|jgi:inosose dehydratase|nr:myo-inosose-2 dehydratase [Clostridiales Family XIII bacterium]
MPQLNKDKIKLGCAPIGWTNDDMPELGAENTFQQTISEMALAGFKGSEVGSHYPSDPDELWKALQLRDLVICNRWFSSFLITKPYEEVEKEFIAELDFLYKVGSRVIGVSEQSYSTQGLDVAILDDSTRYKMNDEEWKLLTEGLDKLGQVAKDKGMKLTFHHHMGTVVQTPDEVERLLAETTPGLTYLLFDTGHYSFTGEDPLAAIQKHIGRVGHIHLKDVRPAIVEKVKAEGLSFLQGVRLGQFTVPGDGAIDYDPIFEVIAAADYEGWFVVEAEQDPAIANPFEYALKARKFIADHAGL